jgi:hypothetical protein
MPSLSGPQLTVFCPAGARHCPPPTCEYPQLLTPIVMLVFPVLISLSDAGQAGYDVT